MQLYPWQQEALHAWQENHFHGIINVVTGAGKTVLALAAAVHLEKSIPIPLRVKIVVPTIPLASQWASAVRNILPFFTDCHPRPGYYHGTRKDDSDRQYMIYVINSARYALARHIIADLQNGYHVLLIADECHHYASPENQKIFDFLRPGEKGTPNRISISCGNSGDSRYSSLGLSATPQVSGYASVLEPALGKEIYQYGFSAAVRANHVCDFSIFQIALSFTADERQQYDELSTRMSSIYNRLIQEYPYLKHLKRSAFFGVLNRIAAQDNGGSDSAAETYLTLSYKRKAISSTASARQSCVLALIEQLDSHGPKARILIFGERISQARQIHKALSVKYPNQTGCYHSEMSSHAKKNTLAAFRNGSIRILVSCKALDEGLDVPEVTVGIILSGSSVSRQKIQRLGRILRRTPEKSAACLYYLYIKESSDDSAFLADQEDDFSVCNLSYCAGDHSFSHPAYEKAAASILEKASDKGISAKLQKEIRLCLLSGLIRPDWMADEIECEKRIRHANHKRERNYWICMKWMAEAQKQAEASFRTE